MKNNPDRLVDADRLQKPFVCIKAAVPFLQQSGVIVNICPPESWLRRSVIASETGTG